MKAVTGKASGGEAIFPTVRAVGFRYERAEPLNAQAKRPAAPIEVRTIERLRRRTQGKEGVLRATPREKEILALLAGGFSDKEIAIELAISSRTVQMHMRNFCLRNDVRNRVQATALWAVARSLPAVGGS